MDPLQSQSVYLDEWAAVLLRPTPDVRFDLKGLHALALRGCWNAILEARDEILHGSLEDHAAKKTYLTLAAFKTSNYTKAAEEFEKLEVPVSSLGCAKGVLCQQLCFVPGCSFAVRLLYALLPFFMGNSRMSIDRLSLLLGTVQSDQRRREMVLWCLANVYMKLKNYTETLKWLNQLLIVHPENQKAWFAVCCVLLLLGDVEYVKDLKKKMTDADLSNVVAGLCCFSDMDYSGAVSCFSKVPEESEIHGVASNNKSVCELFRCNNELAIVNLQKDLNNQPIRHMQEPILTTLCTLFDLRGGFMGTEHVQKLKEWASELIPDDFNASILR